MPSGGCGGCRACESDGKQALFQPTLRLERGTEWFLHVYHVGDEKTGDIKGWSKCELACRCQARVGREFLNTTNDRCHEIYYEKMPQTNDWRLLSLMWKKTSFPFDGSFWSIFTARFMIKPSFPNLPKSAKECLLVQLRSPLDRDGDGEPCVHSSSRALDWGAWSHFSAFLIPQSWR